jgi:DNA-directed RNA polymerase specialized sigma24 family protein
LYERYAPRFLRHFTQHYGFTPEEAEDVVQDAFVNFVRASKTAREVTAVNAWLWRIAINCANDAFRRRHTARSVATHGTPEGLREGRDMPEQAAAPQNSLPEPELVDCVRRAFRDVRMKGEVWKLRVPLLTPPPSTVLARLGLTDLTPPPGRQP